MSTLQQLQKLGTDLDCIYDVHPDKGVIDSLLQDIWFFIKFAGDNEDYTEDEAKLLLVEGRTEFKKYYPLT